MAEGKKRKVHSADFKAKVALEAVRGVMTINEVAQKFEVHPMMVRQWKKEFLDNAGSVFATKRGPKPVEHAKEDALYGEIGRLKMELDWLKKVRTMSMDTRMGWIDSEAELSLVKQCELAGVSRATWYNRHTAKPASDDDLQVCRLIDEEYTRRPFYGSRRMVLFLKGCALTVNRKRVQRLMATMGLAGMAPGPNTIKKHPQHKVYPYLLRGVKVVRPNQVWSTDINYIRVARGFAYLVAIIDWYSRKVLSWRISNSMDSTFCLDCLEDALATHGKPEIFNSDQGSQFTSTTFTDILKRQEIKISMDGRGRALDNIFVERLWRNVKYEDVYLKGYSNMAELTAGLAEYFAFYNSERPHQGIGNKKPNDVYATRQGGGASIPDYFSDARGVSPVSLRYPGDKLQEQTGQRCSAAVEEMDLA